MFQRHFKTMLGPQDDSEEPSIHPTVANMDAIRIMETIDVLQAMLHHQHQLLDLLTEFRQPLQVQSHLEMPGILVQLGHTQRT